MPNEQELLPCPFCGGDANLIVDSDFEGYSRWVEVRCLKCLANIQSDHTTEYQRAVEFPKEYFAGVVTQWNTRV